MPVVTSKLSLGGNEAADSVCKRLGHRWHIAPLTAPYHDQCTRCGEKGWTCQGKRCAHTISQSEVDAKDSYYCDECRPTGNTNLDGDQPE